MTTFSIYTMDVPGGKCSLQHEAPEYDDNFQQAIDHFISQNYRLRVYEGTELLMRYVNIDLAPPTERASYEKHRKFWKGQNADGPA